MEPAGQLPPGAGGRGDPEVGRARVEDDGELLGRGAEADLAVVLLRRRRIFFIGFFLLLLLRSRKRLRGKKNDGIASPIFVFSFFSYFSSLLTCASRKSTRSTSAPPLGTDPKEAEDDDDADATPCLARRASACLASERASSLRLASGTVSRGGCGCDDEDNPDAEASRGASNSRAAAAATASAERALRRRTRGGGAIVEMEKKK